MGPLDFFSICSKCTDEECCMDPYYAFCGRHEIEKIQNFINKNGLDFQRSDWLDTSEIFIDGMDIKYYFIKKIDGACIFLQGKRFCRIQPVKPLDCRCWPLTWDYEEYTKSLIIYVGECPIVDATKDEPKALDGLESMILKEVGYFTSKERKAFSSFEKNETLKKISEVVIEF